MCSTTLPQTEDDDAAFSCDDFMLCTDKLAQTNNNPLAGTRKYIPRVAEGEARSRSRWRLPAIHELCDHNNPFEHIAICGALLSEFSNLQVSFLIINNALVYLLGTDHVNPRCKIEVSQVIDIVKPDKVVVELCKLRACRCPVHMNSIFQNPIEFTLRYMRRVISEIGFAPALIFMADVFSEMEVTGNLHLEFGGEMTGAIRHAKTVHQCQLLLGDRSIAVTIKRRASAMNWWTKIRLTLLVCFGLICRPLRAILLSTAHQIAEKDAMTPHIYIFERDLCLIHAIQTAAGNGVERTKIVAVVGGGHTKGIHQYWGKMRPEIAKIIYKSRFDFRYR